jgi:RNA polymerase sigma-70 factor (ECF subfamily)
MITESLPARGEEKILSIDEIYKKYANMLYWVSFSYMKNTADAEDIVADVFVKIIKKSIKFKNAEHEKAWLLRTTINLCKDNLKHWRRECTDIDECKNLNSENLFTENETFTAVMELPNGYKDVVYLHYYEGYSVKEIAKILKKPQSTIKVHLHKARKLLKGVLENEK